MAILQLRNWTAHFSQRATPIFIAPFLTAETQALCRESGVGFLDLLGNARLAFDNVFIERIVPTKPQSERREIRSLFRRKSGQVLRTLLGDPGREWRVVDLAAKSGVSVGHVSNVRSALIDRELATASRHGLKVTAPDRLLDSWRDAYEGPDGPQVTYYTALHGSVLDDAVRHALGNDLRGSRAICAGFSAAHWIAPYGRTATQYFYAEKGGLERLQTALKLVTAQKGENIFVFLAKDPGVFSDAIEPAPGVFCTSLVQTYLDLWVSGERGREAADHLRRMRLKWQN